MSRRLLRCLVCQLLLLSPCVARDSWPSFRGDAQLSGVSAANLAATPQLLWSFVTRASIESTAAIIDQVVYVGSTDSSLYAIDLYSGKLKWEYDAQAAIKSSPLVFEGGIFFGDEAGKFHCLGAADGSHRWTFAAEDAIVSSATVSGDRLLFGSYDQRLYCIDRHTGAEIWRFETEGYVHASCPVIDGTVLVAGCDGLLRVLDTQTGGQLKQITLGSYAAASPAVQGGFAYLGTFGDEFVALDLAAGEVAWRYREVDRRFPFYASAAALPDRIVVAGRDKFVRALHPKTGKRLWNFAAGSKVDSSPVVVSGRVYFGTTGGTLFGLDLSSGQERWRFASGSPIVASPAVAADRLVIGAEDGHLYCFGDQP
jgi:outer membrane protein assembly factor BamB